MYCVPRIRELSRYIVRNPVAADMVKHVGDWAWSSYKATAGLNQAPSFLKTDWLLSQFASTKAKARKAYQQFVMVYDYQSPWQDLGKADVLGDDTFRTKLQQMTNDSDPNIPKEKLILRHLPLSDIASQHQSRGQWMREAYQEHGYTMQAIADFAGLHHSTVSRFIKKDAKSARNKT